MSDLYFKQKCEHELNDTLCDTKCEAYIGGEGWYLVLANGDLLTREEWEATVRKESCDQCGGPVVAIRGPYPYAPDRMVCPTCLVEQLESLVSDVNLFAESTESTESATPHVEEDS